MKPNLDVRIGTLSVADGTKIHFEHWSPQKIEKVLLFIHGLGDHSGRYAPFVEYFTKQGYKVCLYDQRGHGKSEGPRVYLDRFEILLDDLDQVVHFFRKETPEGLPWYVVGHSLGGQILLNYLARRPTLFRAACAASPNLDVALKIPAWQKKIGKKMKDVWPGLKITGAANPELLSHDPKIVKTFMKDPLVSPYVTARMGDEILKNLETIFSLTTLLSTPLLMVHGSSDHYCSL
ncbi:MAG: alpha/beta fold hydrolase, partial [bacterium]|nr:alpha/beta fold hydrolase [bacterium]